MPEGDECSGTRGARVRLCVCVSGSLKYSLKTLYERINAGHIICMVAGVAPTNPFRFFSSIHFGLQATLLWHPMLFSVAPAHAVRFHTQIL